MLISIDTLPQSVVLELITALDAELAYRLTQSVDLSDYSIKLSKYARFVVARSEDKIVGLIAFYENHNARELYVPYVCTSVNHRKQGVANTLLNKLIEYSDSMSYNVALEVFKTNHAAVSLYNKFGFEICSDSESKYQMKRFIKLN